MTRARKDRGDRARSGGRALDPSTPLSVREAAILAGVDEASLTRLCDDGSLLFETEKRGRKTVRVIRLRDLADVHPEVLGLQPATAGASEVDDSDVADDAATELVADPAPGLIPEDGIAAAVRASGASRDSIIELCQDLETRLDLADRERQASTASLLMSQRRVLDLEVQSRPRPWSRAGSAMLGLLSITAIVLVARLPENLREAAAERDADMRSALSVDLEGLRGEFQAVTATDAAERAAFVERLESSDEVIAKGQRAFEDLARAAQQERETSAEQTVRMAGTLEGLEQRLSTAEDAAQRRAIELDLLVTASGRERARFAERLAAAERVADDARAQLAVERRASVEERAGFERTLRDIARKGEESGAERARSLRVLQDQIEAALQAAPVVRGTEPVGNEQAQERAAPDSWVYRALRTLFGVVAEPPADGGD